MKIKKPLKSVAEQALWTTSPGAMSVYSLASRLPRRPRRVVKAVAVGSVVYSAAKLAYDNSPAVQRQVDLVAAQCTAWGTRLVLAIGTAKGNWNATADQITAGSILEMRALRQRMTEEAMADGSAAGEADEGETEKADKA